MAERKPVRDAVDDDTDDDGQELELEPPDQQILAREEQLKLQHAARVVEQVKIDDTPDPENYDWGRDFRFAFTVKDIFIWTAMVAVAVASVRLVGVCLAVWVLILEAFVWLLISSERTHKERLAARRIAPPKPSKTRPDEQAAVQPREPFRLSFSVADLLVATTISGVSFGLLSIVPNALAAAVLGFLVLAGMVCYWVGFSFHRRVVLAWFMLTAMYLVVSAMVVVENSQ